MTIIAGTKFQLKLAILIFWTKFSQKEHFWSKTQNVNITIEFSIFEVIEVPNISLNWHLRFFGPNLHKKNIYGRKEKKWASSLDWILVFELEYIPNFCKNWQFWFFGPDSPSKCISSLNRIVALRSRLLLTLLNVSVRGPTDTTVF